MSDWRQHAACRDVDPDKFFSIGRPFREAKQACSACRVVIPCFFDALRTSGDGYQAGTTRNDRARIKAWDRRQRARLAREAS
ncbi:WhiB family transcriptional regulator [Nonomuraea sp. NPDC046802]|uniref:WhiB family transcriptional regulator n=1 Tax=Nonomuraea sp. NPDC046802 TaxID=3154919 RepID=UPI0033DAEACF